MVLPYGGPLRADFWDASSSSLTICRKETLSGLSIGCCLPRTSGLNSLEKMDWLGNDIRCRVVLLPSIFSTAAPPAFLLRNNFGVKSDAMNPQSVPRDLPLPILRYRGRGQTANPLAIILVGAYLMFTKARRASLRHCSGVASAGTCNIFFNDGRSIFSSGQHESSGCTQAWMQRIASSRFRQLSCWWRSQGLPKNEMAVQRRQHLFSFSDSWDLAVFVPNEGLSFCSFMITKHALGYFAFYLMFPYSTSMHVCPSLLSTKRHPLISWRLLKNGYCSPRNSAQLFQVFLQKSRINHDVFWLQFLSHTSIK